MTSRCKHFQDDLLLERKREHWTVEMKEHFNQCAECSSMAELHCSALSWGEMIHHQREQLELPVPVMPGLSKHKSFHQHRAFGSLFLIEWIHGPGLRWGMAVAVVIFLAWSGLRVDSSLVNKPKAEGQKKLQVTTLQGAQHRKLQGAQHRNFVSQKARDSWDTSLRMTWAAFVNESSDRQYLHLVQESATSLLKSIENEGAEQVDLSERLAFLGSHLRVDPSPISQQLPFDLEPMQSLVNEVSEKETLTTLQ